MKFATAVSLSILAFFSAQVRADDKADAAKLVGTYTIVEESKNGEKYPEAKIKDVTVRIAANAITTFDKDKKEVYAATYELDQSKKPWRITMTAKLTPVHGLDAKTSGLIEMNGDTVRLIYAFPGGAVPTDFKAGAKQHLLVLKRTAK